MPFPLFQRRGTPGIAPGQPGGDPGVSGLPAQGGGGLLEKILGPQQSYGGLLDPAMQAQMAKQQQNDFLLNLGAGLLAGSGSGQGFGAIAGQALQGAIGQRRQAMEDQIRNMLLVAQVKKAQESDKTAGIQEYEYAKASGYQGSFEDWKKSGGGMSAQQDPAAIQEYNFYSKLTPEQQKQFLQIKRGQVAGTIANIEGAPALVNRVTGQVQQLSTPEQEVAAAQQRAQAEAEARVAGTTQGEIGAKGAKAGGVIALIDKANTLIDKSTGSIGGTLIDKAAGAVGESTPGAEAIASLKAIQAQLIQAMPRLEGPQSDADRKLYIDAAGQIGDPTVPRKTRKAAIRTLREIQERYQSTGDAPSQNDPLGIR